MFTTNAPKEISRLTVFAGEYRRVSKKTNDEVLEKKGRDLGIQMYRGFKSRRWGGAAKQKGRGGIAWREMRVRAARGEGTIVRESIREEQRQQLRTALSIRKSAGSVYRQSWWHRAVAAELDKRQAGIGVLAVGFLWFRRRRTRERGTFYVRNKTGQRLGYVTKGADFLRIVGTTEGQRVVDRRYGISARAVAFVNRDMAQYVAGKHNQAARHSLRRSGLRVR